ncbi:MAG TPA: porin family protein [Gammaproteobacteria bacterium]|jgi:opacity protein-like surface antigen|nr:porin family protein [Gammaproteobacteria bacterium]HJP39379.1 porin family protein [Gammaproteobacteria bacterium]
MKQTALAVMLLLAAGTANADNEASKWLVGGSLSYSEYERDDGIVDDGGVGFKVHAQYRVNSWAGIEGAYYISPDFKGNASTGNTESETSLEGLTLDAIVYLPSPVEEMEFFLKGGYFNFDVDLQESGSTLDSGSEDGLKLGLGAAIRTGDNIDVRAEFDWYDTSSVELRTISIGVAYHF